ncbi:phosphate:acyl-ACP acyltransferase PlsX [Sporolactobacillus inulinus]|uniref:Phosphate:acyl-ACP acyltransferase PlsX n=1 Tax=Sporolactobacillus inulinus TaxID=2078 RepID=A0A4Y1Z638_9BACL|nr:phosphate:acyl-ACP acyltransferase PlsX [Sporolactobacillus inulinus]
MRKSKKDRQETLKKTIDENPFITDDELAKKFSVSVQTIRLDRMELSILSSGSGLNTSPNGNSMMLKHFIKKK